MSLIWIRFKSIGRNFYGKIEESELDNIGSEKFISVGFPIQHLPNEEKGGSFKLMYDPLEIKDGNINIEMNSSLWEEWYPMNEKTIESLEELARRALEKKEEDSEDSEDSEDN